MRTAGDRPLAALHRRLEQVLKRYSRGEVPRIDWLDPLTFTALDRLRVEVCACLRGMRKRRHARDQLLAQPGSACKNPGFAGCCVIDARSWLNV